MIRIQDILDKVEKYQTREDVELVRKAYVYAAAAHAGQTRLSGEPYLSHPLAVADTLAEMRLDGATVTAGLLHDIGRWVQVETKADHAKAGAEMAAPILKRCGFSDEESALVVQAILYHRINEHPDAFSKVLYDADKQSRPCFACPEIGSCKRFANGETAELKY